MYRSLARTLPRNSSPHSVRLNNVSNIFFSLSRVLFQFFSCSPFCFILLSAVLFSHSVYREFIGNCNLKQRRTQEKKEYFDPKRSSLECALQRHGYKSKRKRKKKFLQQMRLAMTDQTQTKVEPRLSKFSSFFRLLFRLRIISLALCVRMPRPFALITSRMAEPLLAWCFFLLLKWSSPRICRPLELPNAAVRRVVV